MAMAQHVLAFAPIGCRATKTRRCGASFVLAIAGCGLAGLGLAGIMPLALSTGGSRFPLEGAAVPGAVLLVGYTGLAGGPLLTGLLSDRYGLHVALAVVPAFCVLAAILFMAAARTYVSDLQQARRDAGPDSAGLAPQPA